MSVKSSPESSGKVTVEAEKTNFLSPLVEDVALLEKESRRRKRPHDQKSVHPADVQEDEKRGWTVLRPGKRSTQLTRKKAHDQWLEDRIWSLLYAMGYPVMNGKNFTISFTRSDGSVGRKQVDVYAEDSETAIVVECKSREERGRRSLQKDIQETISLQNYFRNV